MSLLKVGNKNGQELRCLNTLCKYGIKIVIYCINYRMKSTYLFSCYVNHYENMPVQIYWKFYYQKLKIFR